MKIDQNIRMSKLLEDQINTIENSGEYSPIATPVNFLQSRFISNKFNYGYDYLINYQSSNLGDIINLGTYLNHWYRFINLTELYKEYKTDLITTSKGYDSYVSNILKNRRSTREFASKIELQTLLGILKNILFFNKVGDMSFSSIASGGGLYPISLIYVENKKGDNTYKFQPMSGNFHTLNLNLDIDKAFENQAQINFNTSSGVILFIMDYTKIFQKYGDLALALGFIEIGMYAQTITLGLNENSFACCDIGGFNKSYCEDILEIDGINNHACYAMVLGGK